LDLMELGIEPIRFQEKRYNLRRRAFSYMGKYGHMDFKFRLVEVEPEVNHVLDELFLKHGIVLIGCEPSENYEGWIDPSSREGPHVGSEPAVPQRSRS
jgi:hypothetical protein